MSYISAYGQSAYCRASRHLQKGLPNPAFASIYYILDGLHERHQFDIM